MRLLGAAAVLAIAADSPIWYALLAFLFSTTLARCTYSAASDSSTAFPVAPCALRFAADLVGTIAQATLGGGALAAQAFTSCARRSAGRPAPRRGRRPPEPWAAGKGLGPR